MNTRKRKNPSIEDRNVLGISTHQIRNVLGKDPPSSTTASTTLYAPFTFQTTVIESAGPYITITDSDEYTDFIKASSGTRATGYSNEIFDTTTMSATIIFQILSITAAAIEWGLIEPHIVPESATTASPPFDEAYEYINWPDGKSNPLEIVGGVKTSPTTNAVSPTITVAVGVYYRVILSPGKMTLESSVDSGDNYLPTGHTFGDGGTTMTAGNYRFYIGDPSTASSACAVRVYKNTTQSSGYALTPPS